VYRHGHSVANVLLVLYYYPNQLAYSRFGFYVGRRIGKAVVRNRVRRRMRAAAREVLELVVGGWDVAFTARPACAQADYDTIATAIVQVLHRAGLFAAAGASEDIADRVSSTTGCAEPSDLL